MPVLGGAHVMRVVVDQPGDDGATIEVHHAREWPLVLLDLGVAADREDALALDRQRLGNREPVVHGDDLAVQQHDICQGLSRRCFAAGDGDGSEEKGTYDGAHDGLLEAAACHSIMPQTRVNVRAKLALSAMDLGHRRRFAFLRLSDGGVRQELATAIGPPRHWRGHRCAQRALWASISGRVRNELAGFSPGYSRDTKQIWT